MGMGADTSDIKTNPPPARVAFRSRPTAVAATPHTPPPAAAMGFVPAANGPGTDRDVLMGYQIFLGRDPENSFVINEAKSNPLRGFVTGLMLSGEFQGSVLRPMSRNQPMPHERNSAGPSPEQMAWLRGILQLPAADAAFLAEGGKPGWHEFWRAFTRVPGFPRPADAPPQVPAPAPASSPGRSVDPSWYGWQTLIVDAVEHIVAVNAP